MQENWYVATLVFQCLVEGQEQGPWTVDEQLCLVHAQNTREAHWKAMQLGEQKQHSYANSSGGVVRWKFLGLGDLEEVLDKAIQDGTEIRSRLFRSDNPGELVPQEKDLRAFWYDEWVKENKNRTATEILEGS